MYQTKEVTAKLIEVKTDVYGQINRYVFAVTDVGAFHGSMTEARCLLPLGVHRDVKICLAVFPSGTTLVESVG